MILASSLIELIGPDEQVDQNEYSASVALSLQSIGTGKIEAVTLRTIETGSGVILTPAGTLLFLNADPATAAGDTDLTAAEWATVVGIIEIAAADWVADTAGAAVVGIPDKAFPFETLSNLYMVWLHTDATSFNSLAGDDESLHVVVRHVIN